MLDALASDARTRIANVREGLRSILTLLSSAPGTVVVVSDEYQLEPPSVAARSVSQVASSAARGRVTEVAARRESSTNGKRSRRVGV